MFKLIAKGISAFAKLVGRGGETWPGEIILRFFPSDVHRYVHHFTKIIYVIGTNGKTTTTAALVKAYSKNGYNVITNPTGANQMNGVISNIAKSLKNGEKYIGIFEVDEHSFIPLSELLPPHQVIVLNVVRDQLDRYGEVRSILSVWKNWFDNHHVNVVACASDPGVVWACKSAHTVWFRVPDLFLQKNVFVSGDTAFCPQCHAPLEYSGRLVSHIGTWKCPKKDLHMPHSFTFREKSTLPLYVHINLQAVYCALKQEEISVTENDILESWNPAFGRNERVEKNGIAYEFLLGKNPASWSITLKDLSRRTTFDTTDIIVCGLNNRIPDGKDISWIWDIEVTPLTAMWYVYGDRGHDMHLRLHSEGIHAQAYSSMKAVLKAVSKMKPKRVFILANYSAMLDARREIVGRALL